MLLEQALADHPEDELPIAALQVLVTCVVALAAASFSYGVMLWELPWDILLPHAPDADAVTVAGLAASWTVPAALLWAGTITSALTIYGQMLVFAKLPAVDASVLLTTEPLWAALSAVVLLNAHLGLTDYAGGLLILLALAVNQGLLFSEAGPRLTYNLASLDGDEELQGEAPDRSELGCDSRQR